MHGPPEMSLLRTEAVIRKLINALYTSDVWRRYPDFYLKNWRKSRGHTFCVVSVRKEGLFGPKRTRHSVWVSVLMKGGSWHIWLPVFLFLNCPKRVEGSWGLPFVPLHPGPFSTDAWERIWWQNIFQKLLSHSIRTAQRLAIMIS